LKPKLKAYLVVAGIFLLGTISGAGAGYALAQRQVAELMDDPSHEKLRERRLAGLARKLDLSDDQFSRVRAIVEAHKGERNQNMRQIFERCGPELRASRAKLDNAIKAVLDDTQKQRFDQLIERRRQRWGRGKPGD
jgi:Spy/CpxP family protein refolding chaperone